MIQLPKFIVKTRKSLKNIKNSLERMNLSIFFSDVLNFTLACVLSENEQYLRTALTHFQWLAGSSLEDWEYLMCAAGHAGCIRPYESMKTVSTLLSTWTLCYFL